MGRVARISAVAFTVCAAIAVAAPPSSGDARTAQQRRIVHWFDFEERDDGNYEDLPMNWYIMGRDALVADPNFLRQPLHRELIGRYGYPDFAEVHFDDQHQTSGEHSFYLGLDGGNVGAFLEVGAQPAVPGSDYLVTANVRTEGLERAAGLLRAYFIDPSGQRIEPSIVTTPDLRTGGKWTRVSVTLNGEFAGAAYIGIELEIVQPQPDPESELGNQQIVLEDVEGCAWFDDIAIWQLPHVEIMSPSRVNIIRAPQRPRFGVTVRDLTAQRLVSELSAYDYQRRRVAVDRREVGHGAPMRWDWQPELPGFGWYLLDLQVRDLNAQDASPVARTLSAVLWLPNLEPSESPDAGRFALVAENIPDRKLRMLPTLLDALSLHTAIVSAWKQSTTLKTIEQEQQQLDEVVFDIVSGGGQVVLSLHPVPDELAQDPRINASQPLAVLQGEPEAWLAYLTPVLLQHGQRVRHWQLGSIKQPDAYLYPDLEQVMADTRRRFLAIAPDPTLMLPWRLDQARRPSVDPTIEYAMDVPPGITPASFDAHLQRWQSPPSKYWLYLREPAADNLSHADRVTDLVLRMVHGWEADASGLALQGGWTDALERRRGLLPDPLLGVFANTAHHLTDRRVVGRMPIGPGLECLILNGKAGGMLVAWNDSAADRDAVIDMYLGENPVRLDAWGNAAPLAFNNGRHSLQLTGEPVFITGIDPELAMFRASFQLDDPFVESVQQPHQRNVTLTNPWPVTINGVMRFVGPEGWLINPAQHHFSLAPGQSVTLPIGLRFDVGETTGRKQLVADVQLTARRSYAIRLTTPIQLGLRDIDFHASLSLEEGSEPGQENAVVVCVVTNTGRQEKSLRVFANLWGFRRQDQIIPLLEPGQTAVRQFHFPNATASMRNHPIRTGVREPNGPAILNTHLSLEDIGK